MVRLGSLVGLLIRVQAGVEDPGRASRVPDRSGCVVRTAVRVPARPAWWCGGRRRSRSVLERVVPVIRFSRAWCSSFAGQCVVGGHQRPSSRASSAGGAPFRSGA